MLVKSAKSLLVGIYGCLTFTIPSLSSAAPCVEERVDDAEWVVVDTRITANATHLRQEFLCDLMEDGQLRGRRGASTTLGSNPGVDTGFEIDLARATPSEMGDVFSEPLPSDFNLLQFLRDQGIERTTIKPSGEGPWIKPRSTVSETGRRAELEISGESLTERSPDFLMLPLLGFDPSPSLGDFYIPFLWTDVGDGDWLSIFLDDQLVWEKSNEFFGENELYFAGIDSELFTGTHNLLTFVLNSQGESNASVILAEEYRYIVDPVTVPEPSPFYISLLGIFLIAIRRHYASRRFH